MRLGNPAILITWTIEINSIADETRKSQAVKSIVKKLKIDLAYFLRSRFVLLHILVVSMVRKKGLRSFSLVRRGKFSTESKMSNSMSDRSRIHLKFSDFLENWHKKYT